MGEDQLTEVSGRVAIQQPFCQQTYSLAKNLLLNPLIGLKESILTVNCQTSTLEEI